MLFIANDAYVRDYGVCVPADCVATESAAVRLGASQQMKRLLRGNTPPSLSIHVTR